MTAADDKTHRGEPETHEVEYFAKHHGISEQQARDLIAEHGNNRKELATAVARMKGAVQ